MIRDSREFRRTPSSFHRILGIACAIVAALGVLMMFGVIAFGTSLTRSVWTASMLGVALVFGVLFCTATWALYRFVATPARPLTRRAVTILYVVFAIGALVKAAIHLAA